MWQYQYVYVHTITESESKHVQVQVINNVLQREQSRCRLYILMTMLHEKQKHATVKVVAHGNVLLIGFVAHNNVLLIDFVQILANYYL